jgi:hypothetical protein
VDWARETLFESFEEGFSFGSFVSGVLVDEKLSPGEGEGTRGDRVLCLCKLSMFRKRIAET